MGYIDGSVALDMAAPLVSCAECGEWFHPDELVSVAGQYVCGDCLGDFLREDATVRDHAAEFLSACEAEFLEWFFLDGEDHPKLFQDTSFLSKADKLRWLRLGWEDWKKFHPKEAAEAQREFISASPGEWEDFLKTC